MKRHFWKIEYSVLAFILFAFILLIVPIHIDSTIQAKMISLWKDRYNKAEYMFNAIYTQINEDAEQDSAQYTSHQREEMLIELVKTYMRLSSINKIPWRYRPSYMNKSKVKKNDEFYFSELYLTQMKQIVGIKNVSNKDNTALFMMMFDINGLLPPNTWGKDIYGIYIYDEGSIKPFGYDKSIEYIKDECSKGGKGQTCSYYYLIGGEFND